jgi:hypothetical protein
MVTLNANKHSATLASVRLSREQLEWELDGDDEDCRHTDYGLGAIGLKNLGCVYRNPILFG